MGITSWHWTPARRFKIIVAWRDDWKGIQGLIEHEHPPYPIWLITPDINIEEIRGLSISDWSAINCEVPDPLREMLDSRIRL